MEKMLTFLINLGVSFFIEWPVLVEEHQNLQQ